jgi:AraC family transcriptional regulator, transcriptional activator of the genes for pyochelin and ferripyochelin receptors
MGFELKGASETFDRLNAFFSKGTAQQNPELIEQFQTLDLPHAKIDATEWYFDDIRMGYSEWQYEKPNELEWKYQFSTDLVTLQANLKGTVFVANGNGDKFPLLGTRQHNLFYSGETAAGNGSLSPVDKQASMFFIQFRKNAFLRLTQGTGNEALDRFSDNVLNTRSSILSSSPLILAPELINIIHSIAKCRYTGGLKRLYLLSKSIELLVLQAESSGHNQFPNYKYIKTSQDLDCIMYARDYVLEHLIDPPSLSDLSRIIGINEYKLKRGFKDVFGNTVFGFLSDARLGVAFNELAEGNKSAGQIAADLGYSSLQHFSFAFKKKFGKSPTHLGKRDLEDLP